MVGVFAVLPLDHLRSVVEHCLCVHCLCGAAKKSNGVLGQLCMGVGNRDKDVFIGLSCFSF